MLSYRESHRINVVMKKSIALIILAAFAAGVVLLQGASSEQTWTGEISDSHCGAEHVPISEGDPVLPSPECVRLCIRAAFKYVLVVDDKVYAIANQDQPDLAKFAGQEVRVTGELKDNSIQVSRIEEPLR
jgi:hypothetical protein